MKQFLFLALFSFTGLSLFSQEFTYTSKSLNDAHYVGDFVPDKVQRTFGPVLQTGEAPKPGTEVSKQKLRELKKQIRPVPQNRKKARTSFGSYALPEVLEKYEGNNFSGSVPNDNSFAINRNGQILSVINTTVLAYDLNKDSLLFETSLHIFTILQGLRNVAQNKYDPRVLYDPDMDRFILVFLNGTTFQTSKIIVAFSKTNDPSDGFHIYALNGNPLGNDTWSDYPHIMVSKQDLFITMNTFYNGSSNNSGYVESTIRQVNKMDGYDSLPSLQETYYSDIKIGGKALFNFTGMAGGSGPYSPPIYFMSNRNLSLNNDSLFLVSITDSLSSTTPPVLQLKVYKAQIPYGLPPDARQQDSNRFDCNDSRIQGGYYQNGIVQFVGNTVTSKGFSGFYHAMINPLAPTAEPAYFSILEMDSLDFGYPNICYTGKSELENEGIIIFNHSGPSTNAGSSSVFFSNDSSYSGLAVVDSGRGYVNVLRPAGDPEYERWGDYTGAQPAYGDTGVVWMSAYSSTENNTPRTILAKLRSPDFDLDPIQPKPIDTTGNPIDTNANPLDTLPPFTEVRILPNPTYDNYTIEFELDAPDMLTFQLISINGSGTDEQFLVKEAAMEGNNRFTFHTRHLRNGVYYLIIFNSQGRILKEEKVVKL